MKIKLTKLSEAGVKYNNLMVSIIIGMTDICIPTDTYII